MLIISPEILEDGTLNNTDFSVGLQDNSNATNPWSCKCTGIRVHSLARPGISSTD